MPIPVEIWENMKRECRMHRDILHSLQHGFKAIPQNCMNGSLTLSSFRKQGTIMAAPLDDAVQEGSCGRLASFGQPKARNLRERSESGYFGGQSSIRLAYHSILKWAPNPWNEYLTRRNRHVAGRSSTDQCEPLAEIGWNVTGLRA